MPCLSPVEVDFEQNILVIFIQTHVMQAVINLRNKEIKEYVNLIRRYERPEMRMLM